MSSSRDQLRYDLYERAAQSPAAQARFIEALLRERGVDDATATLREDFSGSGALSRAWVRAAPGRRAVCVDRDPAAIAQLSRRLRELDEADASRIVVRNMDVLEADDAAQCVAALNFSIGELRDRRTLLAYLRATRQRLAPRGLLLLDLYGGVDALTTGRSELELRADEAGGVVRYVWEQRRANPATAMVENAMHFVLENGEELRDAFVYRWRLWSLPELLDALADAGFGAPALHDRLGGAVDDEGALHTLPIELEEAEEALEENFVVYLAVQPAATEQEAQG